MLLQAIISPKYRLKLSDIQINWLTILSLDVNVLSFDLGSLLSWKMSWWMWKRKLKRHNLICNCWLYQTWTTYLGAVSVFISWNKAWFFLWLTTFLNQMGTNLPVFTAHLQICLIQHYLWSRNCFFLSLKRNNHRTWMKITCTGCLLKLLLQILSTSWSETSIWN